MDTPKPSYEELETKLDYSKRLIRDLVQDRFEEKEYRKIPEVYVNIHARDMRDEKGRFLPARFVEEMIGQLPTNYMITPIAEKGGDVIWRYDEKTGVFKPDGNTWTESKVLNVFDEETSPGMLASVLKLTQVKTYDLNGIFTEEPGFITLKNGVFNIEKKELGEFSPDYFSKNALPVTYHPEAKPAKILKFINEVAPDDVDLIQEWFGYHLIKDQRFQKAFIFVGTGANGKSTLVDLCAKWLGEENVSNVSMYELTSDRFATADLHGKLANHAPDLSEDEIKRTGRFKAITGQDKIRAQKKNQNAFSFYSYAKQTFMTNQVPTTPDQSLAFFRRWIIIEYFQIFEGDKADPDLLMKLTTDEELSGLFNWALDGLYRLLEKGHFSNQMSVEQTRQKYEFLADPVTAFIEHCVTDEYEEIISKDKLHSLYRAYCKHKGKVPLPKNKFSGQIRNKLLHINETRPTIDGKRVMSWAGITVICGSKETCQGCQGCQGTIISTSKNNIVQSRIKYPDKGVNTDRPQPLLNKIGEFLEYLDKISKAIDGDPVDFQQFVKELVGEGWKVQDVKRVKEVLIRDGAIFEARPGFIKRCST